MDERLLGDVIRRMAAASAPVTRRETEGGVRKRLNRATTWRSALELEAGRPGRRLRGLRAGRKARLKATKASRRANRGK